MNLQQFLGSLSIESATENTWTQIVDAGYDTLDKVRALTVDQIAVVGQNENRTIGPLRAEKIFNSFHSQRVQGYLLHIDKWLTEDEVVEPTLEVTMDLTGKKVCFTGAGPLGRKDLTALLKKMGAQVQSGVSKTTDILFLADPTSTSSKAKKARDLGVELKAYSELVA